MPRPDSEKDDGGSWLWFTTPLARSDVVILDARSREPIAQLHLKHHIPYGLHEQLRLRCFLFNGDITSLVPTTIKSWFYLTNILRDKSKYFHPGDIVNITLQNTFLIPLTLHFF